MSPTNENVENAASAIRDVLIQTPGASLTGVSRRALADAVLEHLGEHPEFSPEELAEIRRLAANEWSKVHHIKGETAVPSHRDKLTERLLTLERIEEKTR